MENTYQLAERDLTVQEEELLAEVRTKKDEVWKTISALKYYDHVLKYQTRVEANHPQFEPLDRTDTLPGHKNSLLLQVLIGSTPTTRKNIRVFDFPSPDSALDFIREIHERYIKKGTV